MTAARKLLSNYLIEVAKDNGVKSKIQFAII